MVLPPYLLKPPNLLTECKGSILQPALQVLLSCVASAHLESMSIDGTTVLVLLQNVMPSDKSWSFLSDPVAGPPQKSNSSKSEWFSARPQQELRTAPGNHSGAQSSFIMDRFMFSNQHL